MKYELLFEDGSLFSVPAEWRDICERKYGDVEFAEFDERFRFVVGRYVEHRAVPSKFDGITTPDAEAPDYGKTDFYFEHWDDPQSTEFREDPPSMAEIAEGVLYHSMRSALMQKALDAMAAERGTVPPRVITPAQVLEELERSNSNDSSELRRPASP